MTTTPNLSTLLDIPAFYGRYSRVSGKPTNSRNDGKEWHGSCPRCNGQDRFSFWESGRFSCSLRSSGCGIHGTSPYWFLRDVEGYSHRQACSELDIDPDTLPTTSTTPLLPLFMTRDEEPSRKWQTAAEAFLWRSERYLWSGKCGNVLRYLHSRGFRDDTLKKARIGYCPGWYSDSLSNWGLTPSQTSGNEDIKIPEGIVLPFFVSGNIWKLSIRRPDKQYFQVLGSSDAPYNIDALEKDKPVILVEGEFDALSISQEASDLITPLATGGTLKGLSARWIALLLRAPQVLIGFDQDENKSGDTGAEDWLRVLPNALRWTPWAHDVNDMLKTGSPIRLWLDMGLHLETLPLPLPIPEPTTEPMQAAPVAPALISLSPLLLPQTRRPTWLSAPTNERGLPKRCTCGRLAIAWATQCRPYCEKCWEYR